MFELRLNIDEFVARTNEIAGALDQVPFALSRSLNSAAKTARREIVRDTWPSHVNVRNPRFLNAVMLTKFSTKENLSVEFYDSTPDQRAHLELHAKGGEKTPKGQHLAIPIEGNILGVRRTGSGIAPRSLKPRQLVAGASKRELRIARLSSGNTGIFVGRGGRLNLIYVLLKKAQIPASVPFYQDWHDIISREVRLNFATFMRQAMKTRIASKYQK